MPRRFAPALLVLLLSVGAPPLHAADEVTLANLLRQMTDLSLLAEYPDPPFVTKQFSSYERLSETPKDHENWFANYDRGFVLYDGVVTDKTPYFRAGPMQGRPPDGYFIAGTRLGLSPNRRPIGEYVWAYATAADGTPRNGKIPQGYIARSALRMDPQGHVLAEMDGPGCIVRIWSANPEDGGTVRIYLDGGVQPVIEAPLQALLGGKWQTETVGQAWTPFPDPLACERSRGWNLYFPIAYARHCKITVTKSDIYYHVDYRTYPRGTSVETFSLAALAEARPAREHCIDYCKVPCMRDPALGSPAQPAEWDLYPGARRQVELQGPAAVSRLEFNFDRVPSPEALRGVVLVARFDNEPQPQIWCPLGDFFASSPGINSYHSLPFEVSRSQVAKRVEMTSWWPMPFREKATFQLINQSKEKYTSVALNIFTRPYTWTERSMHFHAKWRTQTTGTRPFRDWNFCTLRGRGVFVGDMLSVMNPVSAWWGEGDEKIYVDGESFPSWFGTGTEDYFGYAWCDPKLFQHAYHNQTRCDGPANYGLTSLNRFHVLDAIPFTTAFRFDMELWHWVENIDVNLAATSYWYARPGGDDEFQPAPLEALQKVPGPPPPFRVAGALEGEKLRILGKSSNFPADTQDMLMFPDGRWSGNQHLWGRPPRPGAWIDLELPVERPGRYRVLVYLTKAADYGIVQFHLDGKPLAKPIDGFYARGVVNSGPLDLGTVPLEEGKRRLRIEVVGTNEKSVGLRTMWGLDCVVLKPAEN